MTLFFLLRLPETNAHPFSAAVKVHLPRTMTGFAGFCAARSRFLCYLSPVACAMYGEFQASAEQSRFSVKAKLLCLSVRQRGM